MALHSVDKSISRDNPTPNTHDTLQDVTRQAHGTTSVHPTTDATQDIGYLQTKNGRILVNNGSFDALKAGLLGANTFGFETLDASNVRTFAGNHPTYGQGFFVSKAGSDASTATGNNLIFNSSQDIFKIVKSGSSTLPASGSVGASSSSPFTLTTIIPHGLSFIPAVMVYAQLSTSFYVNGLFQPVDSYMPLPIFNSLAGGGLFIGTPSSTVYTGTSGENALFVWYGIDSTNLYVQYYFSTSAGTGTTTCPGINLKYYLLQETAN